LIVKAALSKSVAQPIFKSTSIAAEKVAEVLALPEQDRAFLAHQLIASLDTIIDADAEAEWREVIGRRSREMEGGQMDTRSEEEMLRDIRAKLDAARHK
jgi:Putative addiction module component